MKLWRRSARDLLTAEDVTQALRVATEDAGGPAAWARKHGVSISYVSLILAQKQLPGRKILEPLGLKKVIHYARD